MLRPLVLHCLKLLEVLNNKKNLDTHFSFNLLKYFKNKNVRNL